MKKLLTALALLGSAAPAIAAPNFDAPIVSAVPMTTGTNYPSGKSVATICTATGTATFVLANGGSIAVPVVVGYQSYPFAVTQVSSNTGTCTTYELY